MKKILTIALVMIIGSAAFIYAGGEKESAQGFTGNYAFGGSTTTEPIFLAAIEEFRQAHPQARISYDSQGSSVGVQGVLKGTYTLGGASRDLKDSEAAEGAKATVIALDGVAVIVNKASVPLDNLTIKQIAGIYSGEITNWKELGGPDAGIVVFNRDEASGTRDCFNETVVKLQGKKFMPEAAVVTSNGDMISKVAGTPYSIGYCGFGYIDRDPAAKALSVNSVLPREQNVLSGQYPVSRKLNAIHKGDLVSGSLEKAFVDFLLSKEGQAIVREERFITIK